MNYEICHSILTITDSLKTPGEYKYALTFRLFVDNLNVDNTTRNHKTPGLPAKLKQSYMLPGYADRLGCCSGPECHIISQN